MLTGWNPGCNGFVYTLFTADAVVYAGGSFDNIAGVDRYGIAPIEITSGALTPFDA